MFEVTVIMFASVLENVLAQVRSRVMFRDIPNADVLNSIFPFDGRLRDSAGFRV